MKRIVEATMAGLIALSFALPTAPNVPDRGQLEPIKAKSERTSASVKPHQTHGEAPNFDLDDLIDYLTADFKNAAERAIDGRRSNDIEGAGADDTGTDDAGQSDVLLASDCESTEEAERDFGADNQGTLTFLGTYTITFYCQCEACCGRWAWSNSTASGAVPQAGWTVAAGEGLPFGSRIWIDGFGEYEVQDRGVPDGWIDIYVNSHAEIPSFGMTTASVFLEG